MRRLLRFVSQLPLFCLCISALLVTAAANSQILIFADGLETGDARNWNQAIAACGTGTCGSPVPDGCGALEICDNGSDDDCNGSVDDGCSCAPGSVQPCFTGPPGRRHIGACVDGAQTCFAAGEFGVWGQCGGGISPTAEALDTQDNDCNGCVDDNPTTCNTALACPGPGDLVPGQPFHDYVIDGATIYPDAVEDWLWSVSGGPCDQLFVGQNAPPSFTVTGADSSMFTLKPTLSGDYTINLTTTLPGGAVYGCSFVVRIAAPGLRIETCSDLSATTDLDLHVHRPGTTSPWFTTELMNATINNDDCYTLNCTAGDPTPADWGYANGPLDECAGGPDGSIWQLLGFCRNPRLEVTSDFDTSVPENSSVDLPENAGTYRVMVHFWGGAGVAHPMVNIYCGGSLEGSYGRAPDLVPGFDAAGGFGAGDMWRVVDVVPTVTGSVTTGCTLAPLHPPAQTTGYWVTTDDRSY